MTQPSKTPSPTRSLLTVVGIGLAFLIVVSLGRQAFQDSLKAPPPAPPAAAPPSQVTGGGLTLASASIELPDDPPYPAGAGADLMNANCTACHSAAMALTQPAFSKAQWTATVEKMRDTYKAQVAEKDVPAIVDYLTSVRGKLGQASTSASSAAPKLDRSGGTG